MKKRFFLLLVPVLLWLCFFSSPALGTVQFLPPSKEVVPESDDFAIRRFNNPWDMSSIRDLAGNGHYNFGLSYTVRNGLLEATTINNDPYFFLLFPGHKGTVPIGRDGVINKIKSSYFNHLSFRLYSSKKTAGQIYWFYGQDDWRNFGVFNFRVLPGWQTYNINLAASPSWTGSPIGLRIDPTYETGVSFKVDWVKLYHQGGSERTVNVSWTDSQPSQAELYLDRDTDPTNNNSDLLLNFNTSQVNNSYALNTSLYPAGTYYFYLKKGSQLYYSAPFQINKPPLIQILDPDKTGGQDFATTNGNPWDMSDHADISKMTDIEAAYFKNGIFSAVNSNSDGYFFLNLPKPINASAYHMLTIKMRYDGYFDFGLGTMSRFIWNNYGEFSMPTYQTLDDIVIYPEWTTYTFCLKTAPVEVGNLGWQGYVNVFRFDPFEIPYKWRFYIDYIKLAKYDKAGRSFTIKWIDRKANKRPTKVSLYYDTDRKGFNGELIATINQVNGTNYYTWNTSLLPKGKYWVYLVATDGVSRVAKYSSGPVIK